MKTEIGTLTAKGQMTLPVALRKLLGLQPGDRIVFQQEGDHITLRKAQPLDVEYYRAVQASLLSEWNSPEDAEAFDGL